MIILVQTSRQKREVFSSDKPGKKAALFSIHAYLHIRTKWKILCLEKCFNCKKNIVD